MFFHQIKICLKLLLQPVNLQACLPIHMRLLGCLTISLCLPAILQWSRVKRPTKPCQSRLSIPGAAVDPGGSHPHHLSKPRFGRTPPSGSGWQFYISSHYSMLCLWLTHILVSRCCTASPSWSPGSAAASPSRCSTSTRQRCSPQAGGSCWPPPSRSTSSSLTLHCLWNQIWTQIGKFENKDAHKYLFFFSSWLTQQESCWLQCWSELLEFR